VAASLGGKAVAVATDVADADQVRAMVDAVVRDFRRIDVLVNNAGYGFTGTVASIDVQDWDRLMATNLRSVFLCAKYVIPVMAAAGAGSIVNLGSYTAMAAIADRAAYVASKGAIVSLTRAMALDHAAQGIRVNCVAPGTIDSPYFAAMFAASPNPEQLRQSFEARAPIGRMGRPEEIASAILWLASDEASFATGAVFTVDGGSSAW
jgi:NAD(P)-dependent dehydrogenase (short-subunit alcohol dehydrogenase family)